MLQRKLVQISKSGDMITVLGLRAVKDNGIFVDIDFGTGYVLVQHFDGSNVWKKLEDIIMNDTHDGRANLIAEVRISNRYAVWLYLEGKLTEKDFEGATEGKTDIVLVKEILGTRRVFRIVDEKKAEKLLGGYHAGTYDAKGELV